jgi:hypothetical protein
MLPTALLLSSPVVSLTSAFSNSIEQNEKDLLFQYIQIIRILNSTK